MILTCPECGTQYFADDSTIGDSGRTVKCTACDHSWFVHPKGVVHDPEENGSGPGIEGAHEAYRRQVTARKKKQSRVAAFTSWIVTASIFFALGASAVVLRQDVVKIWPQSASVYRFMGMDVNRFGLEFTYREATRTFDGTTPVLTVRGQLKNVSKTTQQSPKVRVGLRDELGREIDHVITDISPKRLAADEIGEFQARMENPPVESFSLELSLVELGGARSRPEPAVQVDAVEDATAEDDASGESGGTEG